jgi:hypothetical protein
MYKIYDLESQFRNMMTVMMTDSIVKFEDQGTMVMRVNKNEIAKTLMNIRKDEIAILKDLVSAYRINVAVPSQIAGDDSIAGFYTPERAGDFVYPGSSPVR